MLLRESVLRYFYVVAYKVVVCTRKGEAAFSCEVKNGRRSFRDRKLQRFEAGLIANVRSLPGGHLLLNTKAT